jgi:hypothetical protein
MDDKTQFNIRELDSVKILFAPKKKS